MTRPLLSAPGHAFVWATVSAVAFAASSAAAKFLGEKLPAAELTFFRAAFGAVFLIGVWRFVADLGKLRDPWGHVTRCGLGIVSLYSFMYAVTAIPLALASLLFITRVLLLPVTAQMMLGERSGPLVWGAVIIGFVGAAIPFVPALAVPEQRWGVVAALLASVSSAGSQTAVRRLTATNSAGLIVLVYATVSLAATAPVAMANWVVPPAPDWVLLAALGLFALGAQFAAAKAFSMASVGFLAPFDFLTVPVAAALGFLLFGEIPTGFDLAGGVLVLAAVVAVTRGRGFRSPRS
ncbi:drug/metabolite transporter (DMT)-like permease [Azospirillum agricola]|uniref:DMT family transporter n=1 Tax=Azospirillum agricola TaxID=1720247 RepID=UPI001AE6F0A3|nr:DMT family transporter [Azospirillum agricola]MBP2232261.1 drug/metabolite transporter (DMT)-like permease [Azospirillum agricola]